METLTRTETFFINAGEGAITIRKTISRVKQDGAVGKGIATKPANLISTLRTDVVRSRPQDENLSTVKGQTSEARGCSRAVIRS